ncbi:hypothetical protein Pan44_53320 [Caulifigura coniformis]|uniref:Uncharacterized protein n=1 Tax=Caulifigura coniformis TaxID=2527983 RepID=A0A517SMA6_9PLAN|nr:hypothetical protein [Caulifigura coniformis]QDT57264.1 hypothetical protein Pan44_53320 [Caulifigura coniformis]
MDQKQFDAAVRRTAANRAAFRRGCRKVSGAVERYAGGSWLLRLWVWSLIAGVTSFVAWISFEVFWTTFLTHWVIVSGIAFLVFCGLCYAYAPPPPPSKKKLPAPPPLKSPPPAPVKAPEEPREAAAVTTKRSSRRKFEEYQWGEPPPSKKQFGYAVSLGVQLRDGMTKSAVSDAIDERKAAAEELRLERENLPAIYSRIKWGSPPPRRIDVQMAEESGATFRNGMTSKDVLDAWDEAEDAAEAAQPADKDQLSYIKELHGALPRKITFGEAEKVIEFLEDYHLPCPFCRQQIYASDDRCSSCDKSLGKLRIPIHLPT